MTPITKTRGIAAALLRANIDTDVIIPSCEITSPSPEGFGVKAFYPWRYQDLDRTENPEFILNQHPFREATILLTGENFGCGSSREMAVWALAQFGIKVIIAPSFGSIFRTNCIRNGLLPAVLNPSGIALLAASISPQRPEICVDLVNREVVGADGARYTFEIDDQDQGALLTGIDAIDQTLVQRDQIDAFVIKDTVERPWAWQIPELVAVRFGSFSVCRRIGSLYPPFVAMLNGIGLRIVLATGE